MSTVRYKKLLTNLPSMAAIVNSFHSPEVQLAVFQTLMRELDGTIGAPSDEPRLALKTSSMILPGGEVAHDVLEGDSIHSLADGND